MTWRPSKSPRECSGINRRNTVSCFVIHKYGNGKQRLLVAAVPCASSPVTQSQRVHTKERRTAVNSDRHCQLLHIKRNPSPTRSRSRSCCGISRRRSTPPYGTRPGG